ncbi:MAG: hypothetical protein V4541_12605 [Bacteroidota bacterium]
MKFLKPALVLFLLLALSFAVNASYNFSKVSNNEAKLSNTITKNVAANSGNEKLAFNRGFVTNGSQPTKLPLNADIFFAFTAIASLSVYLFSKNKF